MVIGGYLVAQQLSRTNKINVTLRFVQVFDAFISRPCQAIQGQSVRVGAHGRENAQFERTVSSGGKSCNQLMTWPL